MKEYVASARIDASPETVWEILTDTAKYPEWDPYCERIEGDLALGSKLTAYSKLSPGRGFRLKVTELDDARRMTWRGGMPLGLFTGERTFTLEPRDGGVAFTMREVFQGPMLALIGGSIPDMTEAFEAFAEALKERAEARRAAA